MKKFILRHRFVLVFLALVLGAAILYRDSFTSAFFREDGDFLQVRFPGDFFKVVSEVHYHPVSIQSFYFLGRQLFGINPLPFHLVSFIFQMGAFVFAYLLADKLLRSKAKALMVVFLYVFNVSFFANYYWIAVSYFTLGSFFFLGTAWFYLENFRAAALVTIIFYFLALFSNELSVVLPGVIFLLAWYLKVWHWRLGPIILANGIFLILRPQFIKPATNVSWSYKMAIDGRIFATIRWYILRLFNLPEGVKINMDFWIIAGFVILVAVFLVAILRSRKSFSRKVVFFGGAWFLLAGLPFYFLPDHISAYYLTMAFFGPAVIISHLINGKKLTIAFCLVYLFLAFRGLAYLQQNHWIIKKDVGWPGKFYNSTELQEYLNHPPKV
jgi:hypothetical protein